MESEPVLHGRCMTAAPNRVAKTQVESERLQPGRLNRCTVARILVAFLLLTLAPFAPPGGAPRAAAQEFTPVTDPEKSDVLVLRNGDRMTGDLRELSRGVVTFRTDAAATIYVKWTRVVTALTDKVFEIRLNDGRRYIGSMAPGQAAYRVDIRAVRDTLEIPIRTVVELVRIKKTFWERLDGSVDVGFDYSQQNSKLDLNLSTKIKYDIANNRVSLAFDGSFSRQDSVSDIKRGNVSALYLHGLGERWFWAGAGASATNSQLSLEASGSLGTGPGRFLILSNTVTLGAWIGIYYRTERYTDNSARSTMPLSLMTDFQWFSWAGLTRDVSSRLAIAPVLNDQGRWQISFTANAKRELLSFLYLNLGIREYFDSKPPTEANKNDFSFTTSLSWTF